MRNTHLSINHTIEKENRPIHERSVCLNCVPDLEGTGGVWCDHAALPEQNEVMWPVYFDAESRRTLRFPLTHGLMIGSTGTGKTTVLIENYLDQFLQMKQSVKPSLLVTDLKGDISELFAARFAAAGYEVDILDMKQPYRSARYNFLLRIYDNYHLAKSIADRLAAEEFGTSFEGVEYGSEELARRAAAARRLELLDLVEQNIVETTNIMIPVKDSKEPIWPHGAQAALGAIIWTALHDSEDPDLGMTRDKFTVSNICSIAYSTQRECEEITKWLERAQDILCVKNALNTVYRLTARNTRDGYISTMNAALGIYSQNAVGAIGSTEGSIDVGEIAKSERPHVVFLITDERRIATNHIAMMFINDLIRELCDQADRSALHALPRDFIFLCDEFANLPAMPNIAEKITTLRSRRIWLMMAIQSHQQLHHVYGEDVSATIQDNCDLQLFIGCNNDDTKERFAKSMGKHLRIRTSFGIQHNGAMSASKQSEDVPLVMRSDLDELRLGEFYVRSRMCSNMKSYITPYFEWHDIAAERIGFEERPFYMFDRKANAYDIDTAMSIEHRKRYGADLDEDDEDEDDEDDSLFAAIRARSFRPNIFNAHSDDEDDDEDSLFEEMEAEPEEPDEDDEDACEEGDEDPIYDEKFLSAWDGYPKFARFCDARSPFSKSLLPDQLWDYNIRVASRSDGAWKVVIPLRGTKLAGKRLPLREFAKHAEWYRCEADGKYFVGACSPILLMHLLGIFRKWREDVLGEKGVDVFEKHADLVKRTMILADKGIKRADAVKRAEQYLAGVRYSCDFYAVAVMEHVVEELKESSDRGFELYKRVVLS